MKTWFDKMQKFVADKLSSKNWQAILWARQRKISKKEGTKNFFWIICVNLPSDIQYSVEKVVI
jgi:hypothetical protein